MVSAQFERVRRGLYTPRARARASLPPPAQDLVRALSAIRAYRWAVTGLDLLTGLFHYLPARYPHLVLIEPRGLEHARRALARSDILAIKPAAIREVWDAAPRRVAVLRSITNFRGVPDGAHAATLERAFLDLLVEVRHHSFPYSKSDLQRIWREALRDESREQIASLGAQLHLRPFFHTTSTLGPETELF